MQTISRRLAQYVQGPGFNPNTAAKQKVHIKFLFLKSIYLYRSTRSYTTSLLYVTIRWSYQLLVFTVVEYCDITFWAYGSRGIGVYPDREVWRHGAGRNRKLRTHSLDHKAGSRGSELEMMQAVVQGRTSSSKTAPRRHPQAVPPSGDQCSNNHHVPLPGVQLSTQQMPSFLVPVHKDYQKQFCFQLARPAVHLYHCTSRIY